MAGYVSMSAAGVDLEIEERDAWKYGANQNAP